MDVGLMHTTMPFKTQLESWVFTHSLEKYKCIYLKTAPSIGPFKQTDIEFN
jgi:hypothetical protein